MVDYRQLETILLIEDNEDHIEHTVDALREGGLVNQINVIRDGEQALQYMNREGEFKDPKKSPRPCLVLLDVKLPKIGGFEVLERLKTDEDLKVIPVILLTTTGNKEDIERGARLGANDYIVKPVEFDNFMQKVKGLGKYWALISNLTGQ
ncbi:MAG: response regulator [Spirochaetales bacterium]|nr:response regulator [Spirochaetales bacterium]